MTAMGAPLSAEAPLHGVWPGGSRQVSDESAYQLEVRHGVVPTPASAPLWRLLDKADRYTTEIQLYKHSDGYVLTVNCEGKGRFLITLTAITVDWDGGTSYEHYLQTLALALWLELRGVPCVHANAIAIDDERAIGLIAPSRGGKSTLSMAMMQQGAQLMTDDMLALYPGNARGESTSVSAATKDSVGPSPVCQVYPARPLLRLWPDSLQALWGSDVNNLPKVHERFAKRQLQLSESEGICHSARKLVALFILNRAEPMKATRVERLGPAAALIHLLQNSMLADAYAALNLEQQRTHSLAGLLGMLPAYQVAYPDGIDLLPGVCRQLMAAVE